MEAAKFAKACVAKMPHMRNGFENKSMLRRLRRSTLCPLRLLFKLFVLVRVMPGYT